MKRSLSSEGKGSLDLIEESFCLVRWHGLKALPIHWLGSFPFVLGLLYFVSDMSRSAFASERLVTGSLALTFLFLWMKGCQAIYAAHLVARLKGTTPPRLTRSLAWKIITRESLLQATGLVILPFSLLVLLPFGWVYAFYSNATVLAAQSPESNTSTWKKAWSQATLWPGQNHYSLLAMKLFFAFVALNIGLVMIAAPMLLKILLGWDTVFSSSPLAMLNTTFLACMAAVAYLCVDPLTKAFYTLRCYYGESLATGSDLLVRLRGPHLATLALVALLGCTFTALAQSPNSPSDQTAAASPEELEESIHQTIQKREFTWKLPREKRLHSEDSNETSLFMVFTESIRDMTASIFREIVQAIEKIVRWLNFNPNVTPGQGSTQINWSGLMKILLILLLVALAILITALVLKSWRARRRGPDEETSQTPAPVPDVADEQVGADALPENEWIRLGEELSREGKWRLALRAFYLASLAHLAERNFVSIAKFKSNRDYQRELDRRRHALPEVADLFANNVNVFDRVWYGHHKVTPDGLNDFSSKVQQICQRT